MRKIVVIGGGTGTFVVLSGLKNYDYKISVIVSMMDSGGSTGRLRDQYGVLPPGDLRQCLVALSETSELWRKLFLYRFVKGDLKGHNFGNILITALEKNCQDYQQVVDAAAYILKTKGKVIPVTFNKCHLYAKYQDGELMKTEGIIDTAFHKEVPIVKTYLKPKAYANKEATKAINEANYIIVGPGDIYTGIVPNLLVEGIKQALITSKARLIYIVNLFTKRGQTTNYTAKQHIADIEKYIGRKFGFVIINNKTIPANIISYYNQYKESVVKDDLPENNLIFRADIISNTKYKKPKGDDIFRSILRHDSQKLAKVLSKIIK